MRIRLSTYSTKPRGGVVHTLALAEALAAAGHRVEVFSLARGGDTAFFRVSRPRCARTWCRSGRRRRDRRRPAPALDRPAGRRARRGRGRRRPARAVCLSANAEGAAHGYHGLLRSVHHLDDFSTPELVARHRQAVLELEELVCVSRAVAAEVCGE